MQRVPNLPRGLTRGLWVLDMQWAEVCGSIWHSRMKFIAFHSTKVLNLQFWCFELRWDSLSTLCLHTQFQKEPLQSAREYLLVTGNLKKHPTSLGLLGLFAELKHLNDPVLGLPQWLHSAVPISSSPGSEVHWDLACNILQSFKVWDQKPM